MSKNSAVHVLIAMSDTGGGHRAMSNAIAGALRRRYADSVAIDIQDVFGPTPAGLFERATRLYGPIIRIAPWFYGWLYHAINNPTRYRMFNRVQTQTRRNVARLLETTRPDVVVNTHPLANVPLLDTVDYLGRRTPVLASVSELVSVHTSWVEPRLRLLNTASVESFSAVVRWGANLDRIRCVGLPVDERFSEVHEEPAAIRVRLGLDPDRFTALLIGGGEGAGGLGAIVDAIQPTSLPVQLIVVCGRNKMLRQRLESTNLRTPAHICGFVRTIPELMQAADVVITKGGPQTIAESLVAGRPVILTGTLPGQEEGNGSFVESRGVGFRPGSIVQIVWNLSRLVHDREEREWMTRNARRHGRPEAAARVAQMAMRLVDAA
jgi:1,2-diacylglycerol 3-beta-galactosyltransferase